MALVWLKLTSSILSFNHALNLKRIKKISNHLLWTVEKPHTHKYREKNFLVSGKEVK